MPTMDYILLIDADMVLTGDYLHNPEEFKQSLVADCYQYFAKEPRHIFTKTLESCETIGDILIRVTHEYVQTPNGTSYDSIDTSKLFIQDIGDGGSKQEIRT
jgi:hypothetical protein